VTDILKLPVSLIPVLAFLTSLVFMDSFKLVSIRSVVQAIGVGAIVAGVCYFLNDWLLDSYEFNERAFRRYLIPLIEESLKASFVVFLIHSRRVGFIVDGAIYGFAIGAGFALIENIYYLNALENNPTIIVWIVRGFGTAIMHGSTTAIFAIISKSLTDRYPSAPAPALIPGLFLAFVVHSTFNHFAVNPLIQTAVLVVCMPPLTIFVFEKGEKATRDWLGTGFDTDVELMELISSGEITESRIGVYLQSLKSKFPGQVVGDMLSMLQIHLELSIRAKGILMASEAGVRIAPDEMVKANLKELKFLEESVGKTGMLAMMPFLNMTSRDLWQLYMLGK
jgi:RsiW-degrading membrane proteinase PrsW (M82 family)